VSTGHDNKQINKEKLKMAYERKFNRQSKPTGGNTGGNVKYETMAKEVVEWNPNNFLEITKKTYKAQDGSGEFFSITKGYYANGGGDVEEGTPIYQKSLTLPSDMEVMDSLLESIDKVVSQ
tara:strand:+ start:1455 stop:1817 length:363 start_codon:yes stop_codon:yes gene_type:complete